MTAAGIKRNDQGRIMAILNNIKATVKAHGWEVEGPYDMTGDDYHWCLIVQTGTSENDLVDVSFRICESQAYDGTDEGINFAVDAVKHGGRVLGGLCPFNYTPDVWVALDDAQAIEQRFKIMENAEPKDLVPLLKGART
jgi:hypothetical protein